MIEVRNLTKSFGDKVVLDNINVTFETGKTNLIIGQSGSGKTVLMKNLVGLLQPTSGEVLYDDRDFTRMSKKEKVLMRREMGMIFQSAALFDSLNVLEKGQIIERGSHDELIEQKGRYYQLYTGQFELE